MSEDKTITHVLTFTKDGRAGLFAKVFKSHDDAIAYMANNKMIHASSLHPALATIKGEQLQDEVNSLVIERKLKAINDRISTAKHELESLMIKRDGLKLLAAGMPTPAGMLENASKQADKTLRAQGVEQAMNAMFNGVPGFPDTSDSMGETE